MADEERRRSLTWRVAGVAILLVAWALDAAWWRGWHERWQYGSVSAGVVLAGERWDRHRNRDH